MNAGEIDPPFLHRLTESLNHLWRKLRKLVTEKYAVMRTGNVTRLGDSRTASYERGGGRRVMRGHIGWPFRQYRHGFAIEGLYRCNTDSRFSVQVRQDARQPLGQHRFSNARRSHHEHVMRTRRGYLESHDRLFLPANINQVHSGVIPGHGRLPPSRGWRYRHIGHAKHHRYLGEVMDGNYLNPIHERRFTRICRRNNRPHKSLIPSRHNGRQYTGYCANLTV